MHDVNTLLRNTVRTGRYKLTILRKSEFISHNSEVVTWYKVRIVRWKTHNCNFIFHKKIQNCEKYILVVRKTQELCGKSQLQVYITQIWKKHVNLQLRESQHFWEFFFCSIAETSFNTFVTLQNHTKRTNCLSALPADSVLHNLSA